MIVNETVRCVMHNVEIYFNADKDYNAFAFGQMVGINLRNFIY